MIYKVSQPVGRSVQLALYWVFVVLVGAPMPLFGGWLVTHLQAAGWHIDLRLTFYIQMAFLFAAAAAATRIEEGDAAQVRSLAFDYLPSRAAAFVGLNLTSFPGYGAILRSLNVPGLAKTGSAERAREKP